MEGAKELFSRSLSFVLSQVLMIMGFTLVDGKTT